MPAFCAHECDSQQDNVTGVHTTAARSTVIQTIDILFQYVRPAAKCCIQTKTVLIKIMQGDTVVMAHRDCAGGDPAAVRRTTPGLHPQLQVTCNTKEHNVFVAWMALARQLASDIFIPKSMRSYFMPIEFTPYVTSSWRKQVGRRF